MIEDLVVGQIRAVGQDRVLQARVLDEVRSHGAEVEPADLRRALAVFNPVWTALHLREQTRVRRLLLQGIRYDGAAGTIVLTFLPTGIQALAEEVTP